MNALRRYGSDDRGSILILTAASLVVLLGVTALAIDAGFWFDRRVQFGAAADAGAWAAAQEIKLATGADLTATAKHEVENNLHAAGLEIGSGVGSSVTVTVNNPPSSGAFTCAAQPTICNQYVEVIVSQQTPVLFSKILGLTGSSFSLGNRAVAGPSGDVSGCIYALNATGDDSFWSGYELDIDGNNSHVTATNCALISNGGLNVDTGSTVSAQGTIVHASHMTGGGTVSPAATFSQPNVIDPLADMDQTALFGSAPWTCTGSAIGTGYATPTVTSGTYTHSGGQFYCRGCTATLYPGTYCAAGGSGPGGTHAIDTDNAATITYSSTGGTNDGLFIINGGGLWEQHTAATGTGVTWYFTSDSTHAYEGCGDVEMNIDPNGGNTLTLSAPTTGPRAGLLMVRDRTSPICTNNAPEIELQPDAANLTGVIYFPYDHLQYCSAIAGSSPYTVLIGGTVEIQGGTSDDCKINSVDNAETSYSGAGYSSSPIKRTAIAE